MNLTTPVIDALLSNEHNTRRLLISCYRRLHRHYRDKVIEQHHRILAGPHEGLKLPKSIAHGNLSFPQVMGTYESHISDVLEQHVANYSRFVEFGCACGVYTNGMAYTYDMTAFGIDLDAEQIDVANEVTQLNGLTGVSHVAEKPGYDPNPYVKDGDLVMIDIEGHEWGLIDALDISALTGAMFIIELHELGDKTVPELRDYIHAQFSPTHDVQFISEATHGTRTPPETWAHLQEMGIPRRLASILLAELRAIYQLWAIITPKA